MMLLCIQCANTTGISILKFRCKQRICLDSFGKHKKIVTKGLRVITLEVARLHHELNLIPGKKLCITCRRKVSKHHNVPAVASQHMSGASSSSEGLYTTF